ncbi:hypothetical protein AVEN_147254-1 [Araneus ventricosus]|uniref:Uncharacterized protein n=1 Tax=Araneus ventricosus TaxID=182803 RepID=A0A4Y2TV98_ARAVE|nr:hypothetical protein AVEN_147254-1 [Araneus ventricosus]
MPCLQLRRRYFKSLQLRVPYNFLSDVFKIFSRAGAIKFCSSDVVTENRFQSRSIFCSSNISLQMISVQVPSKFCSSNISLQNRFSAGAIENFFATQTSLFKIVSERVPNFFAAQTSVFKIASIAGSFNFLQLEPQSSKSFPEQVPSCSSDISQKSFRQVPIKFLQLRHQSSKSLRHQSLNRFQSGCHPILQLSVSLQNGLQCRCHTQCSSDISLQNVSVQCHSEFFAAQTSFKIVSEQVPFNFAAQTSSLQVTSVRGSFNFLQLRHQSLKSEQVPSNFAARTSVFKNRFRAGAIKFFAAQTSSLQNTCQSGAIQFLQLRHPVLKSLQLQSRVPSNFAAQTSVFKIVPEQVPYNFLRAQTSSLQNPFQCGCHTIFAAQTSVFQKFQSRCQQILQLRHQSSKSFQSRLPSNFAAQTRSSLQIFSERVPSIFLQLRRSVFKSLQCGCPYNFCSSDISQNRFRQVPSNFLAQTSVFKSRFRAGAIQFLQLEPPVFKIVDGYHTILQLEHPVFKIASVRVPYNFCSSDISLQKIFFRAGAIAIFLQLRHISLQNRFRAGAVNFCSSDVSLPSFQCRCHHFAAQTSVFKIVSERVPYNFTLRHQSFQKSLQVPFNFFCSSDIQSSKSFQSGYRKFFAAQTSSLQNRFRAGAIKFCSSDISLKIVSGRCHTILRSDISLQNRFSAGASPQFLQLNISLQNRFRAGAIKFFLQLRHPVFKIVSRAGTINFAAQTSVFKIFSERASNFCSSDISLKIVPGGCHQFFCNSNIQSQNYFSAGCHQIFCIRQSSKSVSGAGAIPLQTQTSVFKIVSRVGCHKFFCSLDDDQEPDAIVEETAHLAPHGVPSNPLARSLSKQNLSRGPRPGTNNNEGGYGTAGPNVTSGGYLGLPEGGGGESHTHQR